MSQEITIQTRLLLDKHDFMLKQAYSGRVALSGKRIFATIATGFLSPDLILRIVLTPPDVGKPCESLKVRIRLLNLKQGFKLHDAFAKVTKLIRRTCDRSSAYGIEYEHIINLIEKWGIVDKYDYCAYDEEGSPVAWSTSNLRKSDDFEEPSFNSTPETKILLRVTRVKTGSIWDLSKPTTDLIMPLSAHHGHFVRYTATGQAHVSIGRCGKRLQVSVYDANKVDLIHMLSTSWPPQLPTEFSVAPPLRMTVHTLTLSNRVANNLAAHELYRQMERAMTSSFVPQNPLDVIDAIRSHFNKLEDGEVRSTDHA